jgi:voltage-gated potassium channel
VAVTSTILADQTARPSRREIVLALLGTASRLVVGLLVILLMLWLVPDAADQRFVLPVSLAVIASVGYVVFFRRQLKKVYHAKFPTLRAVEALVLVAAMFLAIFTVLYVLISLRDPDAFTEPLTSFSGYYFSLTVLSTVGFGDISPVATGARAVTMVQMALDLVFIAVVIRVVGSTARKALDARRSGPDLPTTAEALGD